MYSALTIALHPMTVLKTRQQVLNSTSAKDSLLHQQTMRSTFRTLMESSGVRGLFRGAGVVVTLAIPARVVYISTLETSRQEVHELLDRMIVNVHPNEYQSRHYVPLVASISGGVAGGLAAVTAQILAVPMDVISQRQMVMDEATYATDGSTWCIVRSAVDSGGWKALYRGFGLSLLSSLPAGTCWWATYGGCQHWTDLYWRTTQHETNAWDQAIRRVISQLVSGTSAAFVASTLTQPIDVTRTRMQVEKTASLSTIVSELKATSGTRGFYRGLGPRVLHMSVWGTVLSSAYELLRHISRAA